MNPLDFINRLSDNDISFFSGVPDSLLKELCKCITDTVDTKQHVLAANEGAAVGLAIGHHLATGKTGAVYMQNSGIGNSVNPLLSLAAEEVYSIPLLMIIGWRGKPGVHDEPQHVKQGRIMLSLLDAMEVPYFILNADSDLTVILPKAIEILKTRRIPVALVIEKNSFSKYETVDSLTENVSPLSMTREEAIQIITETVSDDTVIVSTTGKASRELFENRIQQGKADNLDFLTVGGMGHAASIAVGIALSRPDRQVICLDGDGALLMHMGSLPIIGSKSPSNFLHLLLNNGVHDSVGGQPTVGFETNICEIALASGYTTAHCVDTPTALREKLLKGKKDHGTIFLEIRVKAGSRIELGRPTSTPIQNKEQLMKNIRVY